MLIAEHEVHLRKANKAQEMLANEKKEDSYGSFSFDLQKVMYFPKLTTNEVYYCRQLAVYNLGIHNLLDNQASMYVWNETVASRGAQEISSCILQYCLQNSEMGITRMTAYSDACGGQNRNSKMALMWFYIVQISQIEEINHKFMTTGHSFLPCDRDFGIIENASKKKEILYVPEDWYNVILSCKKNNKFKVIRMQPEDFLSTEELSQACTIRKTTETGEKVEWLKIQWLQVRKSEPLKLFFKYTLQDDMPFSCVSFVKRGRPVNWPVTLKKLYPAKRPLSAEKLADIKKLLKYVPPLHHEFYNCMTVSANIVDIIDEEDDREAELNAHEESEQIQLGENSETLLISLRTEMQAHSRSNSIEEGIFCFE
jgi:hypothetical protein